LELFNSERAPVNPQRLIVMQPLIKWIAEFGFSNADNKSHQRPNGTSLYDFETYGCVVRSQDGRKLTIAGPKARLDFNFSVAVHYLILHRVDGDGANGYLAAS
jgi:hypothetical protein